MPDQVEVSPETRPRVSILVNNYNYGHFLGACLDSLAVQTRAPHEIIVVDDGSTDGSRALLEDRDGLNVILQENAGQAAAMNTGFAAASGDLILFLDADDQLRPHAIEVITRMWTGTMAGMSFRLDKIGPDGAVTGHYTQEVPDADQLPQMLDLLTMPFMPTSGNVFSRAALAWAFPLPEPRWRISADALLVRAAMLAGPMRHIRQTLGDYRVHGGNNYHREDTAWAAQLQRGILDIADAGLDLVSLADRGGFELSRGARAKVLFAALAHRVHAEEQAEDPPGFRAFLDRLVASCPARRDRRLRALLLGARLTLLRSRRARRVVADPRKCSQVSAGLLRWAMGAELKAAFMAKDPPRAPFDGPPAKAFNPYLPRLLTGPEWVRDYAEGGHDLIAETAELSLDLPVEPQQTLRIVVAPHGAPARPVRVLANGEPVHVSWIHGETSIDIPLRLPTPGAWRPTRIQIIAPNPGGQKRFGKARAMVPRLRLKHLVLFDTWRPPELAVLPVGAERPFAEFIASIDGAEPLDSGPVQIDPEDTLHLAVPPLPSPYALAVRLAPDQPEGELQVLVGSQPVFAGDIGPASRIVAQIPPGFSHASQNMPVRFVFKPAAFLDTSAVFPLAAGWLPEAAQGRYGLPRIAPGTTVVGADLGPYLGGGWDIDDASSPCMSGPTAELSVAGDRAVTLELEPCSPLAEEVPIVMVVTVDGVAAARLRLVGPGRVRIALPARDEPSDIGLHAASEGADGQATEDHSGVVLRAIRSEPKPEIAPPPAITEAAHIPPLFQLLSRLKNVTPADAPALRDALDDAIASTRPTALWNILSGEDLERFCDLADMAGATSAQGTGDGEEWLAALARAMLAGPASTTWLEPLAEAPHLTPDLARAFARFLVRDLPWGLSKSQLEAHQSGLVLRLEEARRILSDAPLDSARYALACEMLDGYRGRALLFSDLDQKPHVTAFAAALETRLTREGHDLALAPAARALHHPRIGILVLDTGPAPETAIARAMIAGLSGSQAHCVLITGDADAQDTLGADAVLSLKDCTVSDCVSRIRSLDLDTLVVGTLTEGAGIMAQVVAHRLAPRQVAMSAVWPVTPGFASFDTFVMGDWVTPGPARRDYAEATVLAPGTGQSFGFPEAAPKPTDRAATRRRLGADDATVVMVTSAMMDKISREALTAWVRILANAPEAILVLYPFAPNWKRDYDLALFEHRLSGVCAAHGVPRRQIRLLPSVPGQVPDILAAGDLYLDSFPYSGATTVIEALTAGLPVVARKGRTQRGHQAAGWLKAYGLEDLIAGSDKAYVETATGLAQSPEALRDVSDRVRGLKVPLGVDAAYDAWLPEWLAGTSEADPGAYRYLFRHIAKTGGTSLRMIFGDWFDLVEDYHGPWDETDIGPAKDLERITSGQMLVGHYRARGVPLFERYPKLVGHNSWRQLTFVRDPLDMALSSFHFDQLVRPEFDDAHVTLEIGSYLRSWSGGLTDWLECDETNWRAALDRYWFIGTLERFDDCVAHLAKALNKPQPKVAPFENATHRGTAPDPADVAIFKANNVLDYEIYAEVTRRLEAMLGPTRD